MPAFWLIIQKIGAFLAPVLSGLFGKWLEQRSEDRKDKDRVSTHERAATAEGEAETLEVINETADERSRVDPGDDVAAVADGLRRRKTGSRHFGNPGAADKDSA